ncbi:hypothetical protein M422DRAFT_268076 [Sphaerobolus stellatus SS14]|uniref:Uncharacterized protein n=1 Tax=Sphaerobolus stellatus (strain SS14) TaxID=990650 RepID=A0A0C9UYH2_SPHS4|nr:hypothetical protein M422DRAFT_268076 [Sphaerobolus stellatus SS14]
MLAYDNDITMQILIVRWTAHRHYKQRSLARRNQKLLNGINGQWANNSKLTIFGTNDLNESLAAARKFVTQDQLPREHGLPHCFLPLHLWLDKGKVSHATNKHPIVLRPVFLPSEIRNASGNGEGVFIGFMTIVGNPNDSIEAEDDTPSSVELAQFKQEVYHKLLHVILKSIRKRSHHRDTLELDGEEGCSTCGTRGANANHPCPKCLAPKEELTQLSKDFAPRLQLEMRVIFEKAKKITSSTARMSLLRDFGLHFMKNTFWKINNSSPYEAYSYDILHSFDIGEWGKHLWPLLLEVLKPLKNTISRSMRKIPRWRGLKHFSAAAEIDFADGNSFRDILKINRIDENQEAIARIRMFVDFHDEQLSKAVSAENLTDGCEPPPEPVCSQDNYALGSPLQKLSVGSLESATDPLGKDSSNLSEVSLTRGAIQMDF